MSTKRKRAVLSIKDEQIIISCQDRGEKGTNLAQELRISKQQISVIRKNKDKILKKCFVCGYTFCLHFFLINIHIFDYLDSRLSGLFTEVPTSLDNRGSTVYRKQNGKCTDVKNRIDRSLDTMLHFLVLLGFLVDTHCHCCDDIVFHISTWSFIMASRARQATIMAKTAPASPFIRDITLGKQLKD